MNSPGIVYEILKNKVIVLNPKGEFLFIKKEEDAFIGQIIKYSEADICRYRNRLIRYIPAAACIAAALIFVMLFLKPFYIAGLDHAYGFVDIDINPSVELTFDKEYKVLKATSLNGDASEVIKGLDLDDEQIYSAVSRIIERSESLNFIDSKSRNIVLVSAALNKENKEYLKNRDNDVKRLDELLTNIGSSIEKSGRERGIDIVGKTIKLTPEEREMALKYKLSMGKYHLFLEAKEKGIDLKIGELKESGVSDLLEKLELKVSEPVSSRNGTPGPTAAEATPSKIIATEAGETVPAKTNTMPVNTPYVEIAPSKAVSTPSPGSMPSYAYTQPSEQTPPVNGSLKIQFYSSDKNKNTQGIHINFKIINTGAASIDLKKVKVRYYFTGEGTSPVRYASYYFSRGDKNDVHGSPSSLKDASGADRYMEIAFDTGDVLPGQAAYVQGDLIKADWSYFDQSNDYSFNPSDDTYADWGKTTAYISGVLAWGREP